MDILADVGGRPGLDCKGFCSYCYFKGVKGVEPFGCKNCMPFKKGCDYCSRAIIEGYPGFKPLDMVVFEVAQRAFGAMPDKVTISGGGDLSCYPDLLDLVTILSQGTVPVSLGYTSGKGFVRGDEAEDLIGAGVREVSFTVFSTRPELRKKYMGDRHPEAALSNLEIFCQKCDVYCAAVLIPGVNDGPELEKTCSDLVEMGAKGLILMRFANAREQGIILRNGPILSGVVPHTVEEFRQIVTDASGKYDLRITGTPLWDPGDWSALCPGTPQGGDKEAAQDQEERHGDHELHGPASPCLHLQGAWRHCECGSIEERYRLSHHPGRFPRTEPERDQRYGVDSRQGTGLRPRDQKGPFPRWQGSHGG